ncbi:hypothetical protein Lesp01_52990 [Lentzea sp. NBRC 102530]|nr:hypothetical protein Lesp01_52990 [Lentzea sp. NBRC 102530]
MSLVRKIAVGLAAGGGVLLAVSPASAAPLSSVDSLGENGPHTTVSDVRESFQGNLAGVREQTQGFTAKLGG